MSFCFCAPTAAAQTEPTLILSRNAAITMLYARAPVDAFPVAAQSAFVTQFVEPGLGTFSDAQRALKVIGPDLSTGFGAATATREMRLGTASAIFHRPAIAPPFQTPLDASIAAVTCASPSSPWAGTDGLEFYVAFRADLPLAEPLSSITVPPALANNGQVHLRIFDRGEQVMDVTVPVTDNGQVTVPAWEPARAPRPRAAIVVWLSVLALAFGGAGTLLYKAFRQRHTARG